MRNDRGEGGEGVGKEKEIEMRSGKDEDILGKERKMKGEDWGKRKELKRIIEVGKDVERIEGRIEEEKRIWSNVKVDGKEGEWKGGWKKRRLVYEIDGVEKERKIEEENLKIGNEVMEEGEGMRGMEMGEKRNECWRVLLREIKKRLDKVFEGGWGFLKLMIKKEKEIEGKMVIERKGGVEEKGGREDKLRKKRIDVNVNVLEIEREGEFEILYLIEDGFKEILNLFVVLWRNDESIWENGWMGEREMNIMRIEIEVEKDWWIDILNDRIGKWGKKEEKNMVDWFLLDNDNMKRRRFGGILERSEEIWKKKKKRRNKKRMRNREIER